MIDHVRQALSMRATGVQVERARALLSRADVTQPGRERTIEVGVLIGQRI
jgi:hypothetical protein